MNAAKNRHPSIQDELKAFQVQNRLFEILFEMTGRPSLDEKALKVTMKEALKVAADITGADSGSLFLLDQNGQVTDTILSRGEVSPQQAESFVGTVLKKGLAGWVKNTHKVGLVRDTRVDSRWYSFPDQPYLVGSALAIPIIRHDYLFGILTLMHPETDHFKKDVIALVRITADQMAVALENAQLYSRLEQSYRDLEHARVTIEQYSETLTSELRKGQKIQQEFLPYKIPSIKGYTIESYFQPALQLSGDFLDLFLMPGNRMGMVIANVSDKGVGAALFMALTRSLIRIFLGHFAFYNSVFNHDSGHISTEKILSAVSLTNEYIINGGHEPLMIIDQSGIKNRLKASGPAIGVISGVTNCRLWRSGIMISCLG